MEAAFAAFPDAEFEVKWAPFQLMEGSPTMSKLDGYRKFMGDEAKIRGYWKRLETEGSQTGINFEFDGQMGDTFEAHQLAEWALETKGPVMQDKLVEAQFSEYMEIGAPPSDRASLLRAVEKVGLDPNEAKKVLENGQYAQKTKDRIGSVRGKVQGVPHFYINGKDAGSGAMPTEEWVGKLRRVA